jgi:formylmethanofuran dehydrogenase subunit E
MHPFMMVALRKRFFATVAAATLLTSPVVAETPDEWIALGARVHGAFGSFIPLGIKIGLDATERLKTQPRELAVAYYDSDKSPCACFADGIAIATYASVGQRTLTVAPEQAPEGALAMAIIRPRKGGPGFKYTVPISALAKLGPMNKNSRSARSLGRRHERGRVVLGRACALES